MTKEYWNYFCSTSERMEQRRTSECSLLARGQLRLRIKICQEILVVFVYEASHLKHPKLNVEPCSVFVKISVIPKDDSSAICKTKEVDGSDSPTFNELLTHQILPGDSKKRLWITAWCRDNSSEQADLIGCMSFGMTHLQAKTQKKPVEGWFCLLSESVGRRKHIRTPASNAWKERVPGRDALPPVSLPPHPLMPVMIFMHKYPTGFGFTLRGSCPIRVGKVEPHSSAAVAGLASGDYIESVNCKNVSWSSAESVAAIVKSTEKILILDVYRPRPNHRSKRHSLLEEDENLPAHADTAESFVNAKKPQGFQLLHNVRAKHSQRDAVWCRQATSETISECVDPDSRMIKRRRLDRMRTFRSQIESTVDYNIFVRQEERIEEVIYEEIDDSLRARYCRRDEVMSCASEKCLAPSTLPDSGVSSGAVSVASEQERAFVVPQRAPNNGCLAWDPWMSPIGRTLEARSPLRGIGYDSDCSFDKVANGDSIQETLNSNEISDRLGNKAFLSGTTTSNDERISSAQVSNLCQPSSKPCDIVLHRFLSCEESFVGNILSGVQRFSWPLRHCILSRHQHATLFQNIEKLMVLSEVNVRSLRSLCSCNSKQNYGASESAIASLYTSQLKLMSQAYSQYLSGMTSSWHVLRELCRCPEFLTFIQKVDDTSELTMETFLQQPIEHLQKMINELQFLVKASSGSTEDLKAFQTIASALTDLLQKPSATSENKQNLILKTTNEKIRKIDRDAKTSSDEHRKLNSNKTVNSS